METRLSVLFWGKKNLDTTEKKLSIYLRVTINGERFEVSTMRYIEMTKWSFDSGKAKGNSEESRSLNYYLDTLKKKVYDYQQSALNEGVVFTKDFLRRKWHGLDEQTHKLIQIFQQHNEQIRALVGIEVARPTLVKFRTTLDHTVSFIQWKYKASDMDIHRLDFSFLTSFEFYLKTEKKCNHNTTIKYLSNLRKIVNICIKNGWLSKDPFFGFKMSKKEVIREFLTVQELQNLQNKDFGNNRLNMVRDIFLFSCFTGLAYIDARKLKRNEICLGLDGEKWIFTRRKKTDSPARIPILPLVQQIIDRYSDHPKCDNTGSLLPVPSNQKLNAYLKEIADILNIKKYLTFHMARHTFATTVTLNNGVPIESVSNMLGHKSIKITQQYAKILDRKVSDDMQALKIRLQTI